MQAVVFHGVGDVPEPKLQEPNDAIGEFRRLTDVLGAEQLSATLIRIPPHSDFEQGTGHFHDEVEEL
jgi:hypothetical protein